MGVGVAQCLRCLIPSRKDGIAANVGSEQIVVVKRAMGIKDKLSKSCCFTLHLEVGMLGRLIEDRMHL